ncbi:hypothetical protein MKW98_013189 [Papaver atlanticum]|uniref:Uncharacterized protein n=1 Tax=Papaver atlanticum TaxID=357466 RepID=A0AAD4T8M8_9MAGN|nr:hypothetical protein MKW98_013189 [Papaver atlanticum]
MKKALFCLSGADSIILANRHMISDAVNIPSSPQPADYAEPGNEDEMKGAGVNKMDRGLSSVNEEGLFDLGLSGYLFTWSNHRHDKRLRKKTLAM